MGGGVVSVRFRLGHTRGTGHLEAIKLFGKSFQVSCRSTRQPSGQHQNLEQK